MAARNPSGTFTKPNPAVLGTPVPKIGEAHLCCCVVSPRALAVVMALLYISTAVLSGISVGHGIDSNMTQYQGQVRVNANYTVTKVKSAKLDLRTGWLRYENGTVPVRTRDLTDLSTGSGALGYISAFLLLVSLLVAFWKFLSVACVGSKSLRKGSVCLGLLISLVMIVILISLFATTSKDLDSYAHNRLRVAPNNSIAMEPGSAWYCGFFAAIMWTVIPIFSKGAPDRALLEYHQF